MLVLVWVSIPAGGCPSSEPGASTPAGSSVEQATRAPEVESVRKERTIERVWSLEGFKAPESVLFDVDRQVIYVSNINGSPTSRNRKGFLSRVSPDGKILALEWVTGLNAPKGLARVGDRLFVADIDTLVEVDIPSGKVTHRYRAAGVRFLNDVAADRAGRIYVSDMLANAIYRLQGDRFSLWVKDDALESPNGLLVEDQRLVVAAWGAMTDGWTTEVPGHLKTVSLEDRSVASLGSGQVVGNLDGLEPDGNGAYFATDFTLGRLLRISPDGSFETLLQLRAGTADLEYVPAKKRLFIPQMNDGRVDAYEVP